VLEHEYSSILSWLIFLPMAGALLVLAIPSDRLVWIRRTAAGVALTTFILAVIAAAVMFNWAAGGGGGSYGSAIQLKTQIMWIGSLNAEYFVGVDGLSMPLVVLTAALGTLACWAGSAGGAGSGGHGVQKHVKGYYALFLFWIGSMLGALVSLDLLLFYVFFELTLLPAYFLIGIWGTGGGAEKKERSALKFFLFGLAGSVALLVVLVGVHFYTRHLGPWQIVARYPHGCLDLTKLATDPAIGRVFGPGGVGVGFAGVAFWLVVVCFGMRLSAVPGHTWLPDALVAAPTPVSMMLAGAAVNLGGYGLLRVAYPIFHHQAQDNWYWLALAGVVGLLYGGLCALGQRDFKRMVAYSCVSLAGVVVLGIAVMTQTGLNGAVYQMLGHGVAAAMMFFVVGIIEERAHHREMAKLGGLWSQMPTYTAWAAMAILASIGLPGLCGFVGQLLVLLGTFGAGEEKSIVMQATGGSSFGSVMVLGVLAASGGVLTAGYYLWAWQRVYLGQPRPEYGHFSPLRIREKMILASFGVMVIGLGIVPGWAVLEPMRPTMEGLMNVLGGKVLGG